MSDLHRHEIILRCRKWFSKYQCPLPVDLHLEAEAEGIDTKALEDSALQPYERKDYDDN